MGAVSGRGETAPLLRVCFWFNAQQHQLLHGLSIACALSRMKRYEVTIASPSEDHIRYAQALTLRMGGENLHYHAPRSWILRTAQKCFGGSVPPKLLSLAILAPWFRQFDAIAVPERTSLLLKKLGVTRPKFVHLDHGAGDRAIGFDPRIRHFDFVLMAGEKHRSRLLREQLIREGCYAVVGYPKFEAADAARDATWTPFPGSDRPVILYNPHFTALGSWDKWGEQLIDQFAAQDRYNLIVAPHVRLFDNPHARAQFEAKFGKYRGQKNIWIDTGSSRSIDMTYTALADVYVGDVSSQVYEFLRYPRPCLFLNANSVSWRDDENYLHWHFGPVLKDCTDFVAAVDEARRSQPLYAKRQRKGFASTFSTGRSPASQRAADAISAYLRSQPGRQARDTIYPIQNLVPLLTRSWQALGHTAMTALRGNAKHNI